MKIKKLEMSKTGVRRCFVLINSTLVIIWFIMFLNNPDGAQRHVLLFDKNDWFMDFYNTVYYSTELKPYAWGNLRDRNYLPLVYLTLYPFSLLYGYNTNDWNTSYAARYDQIMGNVGGYYLVISFVIFLYPLYKLINTQKSSIEKAGILFVFMFSYITLYSMDRANLWIITAGLSFLFLLTYESDNGKIRYFGITCLVIASVLKIFPVLFGFLLLHKHRYKDILIAIIEGIVLTFVPFIFLDGGFFKNIMCFYDALKAHALYYKGGAFGFGANTVVKGVNFSLFGLKYVCLIATILLVYLNKNKKYSISILTLAIILTSGQQGLYALLFLFYPILMFLYSDYHEWDILVIIVFTVLIQPIQYSFSVDVFQVNNNTVMNTLLMLMYLFLIVYGIISLFNKRILPS